MPNETSVSQLVESRDHTCKQQRGTALSLMLPADLEVGDSESRRICLFECVDISNQVALLAWKCAGQCVDTNTFQGPLGRRPADRNPPDDGFPFLRVLADTDNFAYFTFASCRKHILKHCLVISDELVFQVTQSIDIRLGDRKDPIYRSIGAGTPDEQTMVQTKATNGQSLCVFRVFCPRQSSSGIDVPQLNVCLEVEECLDHGRVPFACCKKDWCLTVLVHCVDASTAANIKCQTLQIIGLRQVMRSTLPFGVHMPHIGRIMFHQQRGHTKGTGRVLHCKKKACLIQMISHMRVVDALGQIPSYRFDRLCLDDMTERLPTNLQLERRLASGVQTLPQLQSVSGTGEVELVL
mmetsp:Transcript_40225/g.86299  ORF Transcript_40225/g.86299 Transcript_40225/m.86299 type:complete len:352 (+) Transcript_40225:1785-2840(+)